MIRARIPIPLAAILMLPWLTTGCDPGDPLVDLRRDLDGITKTAEAAERKSPQVPPVPELVVVQPFIFESGGRRNPFAPEGRGDQAVIGSELAPDPARPKEVPSEFIDLDGMAMVGYLRWEQESDRQAALIRFPPRNQPRIVQSGTDYGSPDRRLDLREPGRFIGTKNGTIRGINDLAVDIVEIDRDERGNYLEVQRQLPLRIVPGGGVIRYDTGIDLEVRGIHRIYRQRMGANQEPTPEEGGTAAADTSADGTFVTDPNQKPAPAPEGGETAVADASSVGTLDTEAPPPPEPPLTGDSAEENQP